MQFYKKYVHVLLFVILVLIVFTQSLYTEQSSILSPVFFHTLPVDHPKEKDQRVREVQEKSSTLFEDAEDAYIDKVWKKTPGRDGRKVNIEKTIENMKNEDRVDDSLFIYESIKPNVQLSDLPPSPIYRGHPKKDMVALLINVSWGAEHIPPMLEALKKHQVKATFFIEGKWAKEQTTYVQMIQDEGHLIGNHAYNHPDMKRLSKDEIVQQMNQTNEILEAITNTKPQWFAPPSGSFNMDVVEEASKLNMETILWTVDTIDWRKPSVPVMHARVMDNIHNGATILMHPTEVVAKGLEELIEEILHEGYRIGTIEQLLRSER
ncbi:MAG TPA: polysaccharide deacetylase family protein [Bacillota bacterium]|nr:polysaccharide deacetylase family protein [Bacillota bacterium]